MDLLVLVTVMMYITAVWFHKTPSEHDAPKAFAMRSETYHALVHTSDLWYTLVLGYINKGSIASSATGRYPPQSQTMQLQHTHLRPDISYLVQHSGDRFWLIPSLLLLKYSQLPKTKKTQT